MPLFKINNKEPWQSVSQNARHSSHQYVQENGLESLNKRRLGEGFSYRPGYFSPWTQDENKTLVYYH